MKKSITLNMCLYLLVILHPQIRLFVSKNIPSAFRINLWMIAAAFRLVQWDICNRGSLEERHENLQQSCTDLFVENREENKQPVNKIFSEFPFSNFQWPNYQ